MSLNVDWIKVNDFLTDCGSVHNSKEFSINVINKIDKLMPFDQAHLFFVNDNSVVYDEYLLGIDKKWTRDYLNYYSTLENGRYSIFGKSLRKGQYTYAKRVEDRVLNWAKQTPDEFVRNYAKPLALKYSFGFHFHDLHNFPKCMFVLDRVTNVAFSSQELETMSIILMHLENLYRKFYTPLPQENIATIKMKKATALTPRESEVADLIIRGVSTTGISKKLCISPTTVYKHISHIYEKLHVTNRQALTVRLLGLESNAENI